MVKTMPSEQVLPMRTKGRIIYETKPKPVVSGAEPSQKQQQNQTRARGTIVKGDRPLPPNWKCYQEAFAGRVDENGNWLNGVSTRLPKCRVCGGTLHKNENHVCDGFVPKYEDFSPERLARLEQRRQDIHAARIRPKGIWCGGCDALIESEDDARWHDEHCREGSVVDHRAINGDEDDLSGYEDEPEDDYCEGDDDGHDCD
jgi:hypothetical protein